MISSITHTLSGCVALKASEQPTVKAASVLLCQLVSLAETVESIQQLLVAQGRVLVQYALEAVAGSAPRSYLTSFTDILHSLNTHCISFFSQWLEVSMMCECGVVVWDVWCVSVVCVCVGGVGCGV